MPNYPNIFRNALSYQYFIAKLDRIDIMKTLENNAFNEETNMLLALEVNVYFFKCEKLKQLYVLKEKLNSLLKDNT